jgi:hypothetical protein
VPQTKNWFGLFAPAKAPSERMRERELVSSSGVHLTQWRTGAVPLVTIAGSYTAVTNHSFV